MRFPIIPVFTCLLLAVTCGASAQIHTDRPAPLALPLPEKEESFDFIIFGDRTSGTPAGLPVLEQAVADTNLIGPDLVMTVGDLVQGYNQSEPWLVQMREYRGIMEKLRMPWFPVAGNHDIYWRGEGRPAGEHEEDYEKHFGPLWYWFAHKGSGFLVLFSDEGDLSAPEKPRSFKDPAQQKFSAKQLEWIGKSLAEMKDLKSIFVFMHQPRWDKKRYPGSNWEEVHKMLAAHGGVKACFAGHIHRMRHDGLKDGILYHTLATTGGSSAGDFPDAGHLHHFNLVSVQGGDVHISAIPVGAVIDPASYTAARTNEFTRARKVEPKAEAGFALDATGNGSGTYRLNLSNPTKSNPVEVTLTPSKVAGWTITPAKQTVAVQPGGKSVAVFEIVAEGAGTSGKFRVPVLEMDIHYLEGEKRIRIPGAKFPIETVRK